MSCVMCDWIICCMGLDYVFLCEWTMCCTRVIGTCVVCDCKVHVLSFIHTEMHP